MLKIVSNNLEGCIIEKNNGNEELIKGSFLIDCDLNIIKIPQVEEFTVKDLEILKEVIVTNKINCDLVLIGCGNKFYIPRFEILDFLNKLNINYEWQVTSSAVHTNNLLIEDGICFIGVYNFN